MSTREVRMSTREESLRLFILRHRCAIRHFLPLACLAVVACGPRNPSEESRLLQDRLIPDVEEWGRGSSQVYQIYKHPAARQFEYVCAVPQYFPYSKVEKELGRVLEYRGHIDVAVPEHKVALVGIKGDIAHVAYMETFPFNFYAERNLCHRAGRSILRRKHDGLITRMPTAVIEELK